MASTNSTTHYELSQYIGTDKPTYLVDYNQDMSKIDTGIYAAKSEADTNSTSIGTLSNLTTTAKTNLVSAINEIDSETAGIGTLSSLTTTAKTDLVSAINEVNGEADKIGDLTSLTTTSKTSVVSAINEVVSNEGDLTNLTTTAKSNLVGAINELDGDIGTLSNLNTTTKSSLVSAVNEVNSKTDIYSTTEQLTNKVWTNGKPMYRIVITRTVNANAEDRVSLATLGITNEDFVIIDQGASTAHYSTTTGGSYAGIVYYIASNNYANVYIDAEKRLVIQNQNSNQRTYTITFEYTKTTD